MNYRSDWETADLFISNSDLIKINFQLYKVKYSNVFTINFILLIVHIFIQFLFSSPFKTQSTRNANNRSPVSSGPVDPPMSKHSLFYLAKVNSSFLNSVTELWLVYEKTLKKISSIPLNTNEAKLTIKVSAGVAAFDIPNMAQCENSVPIEWHWRWSICFDKIDAHHPLD